MDNWQFLNDFSTQYNIQINVKDETSASINNPENGKVIEIFEDTYFSSDECKDTITEFTVRFSTQHRHFEDINEVKTYITNILNDEVLPIEFYSNNETRFGGEIYRDDFNKLSVNSLSKRFGYSEDYISMFYFEIKSWSGKYDKPRLKVSDLVYPPLS